MGNEGEMASDLFPAHLDQVLCGGMQARLDDSSSFGHYINIGNRS